MFNRARLNRVFPTLRNLSWKEGSGLVIKRCKHENAESISALYVPNRHRKKVFPVLLPDLDYDFVMENWEAIKHSTTMRKLDLPQLLETTTDEMKKNIQQLKLTESEIQKVQADMTAILGEKDKNAINQLKEKRQALRETFWHYEDSVVPLLLKRPNLLHPEMGQERKIVSKSGHSDSHSFAEYHMDLGCRKKCLFFPSFGPGIYYMVGELAQLELAIIDYFQSRLRNEQYNNISAPNFVQTAIIEACGKNPLDPNSTIILKRKKEGLVQEYLVGSATVEALTGFLTRMYIPKKILPMQLYSVGRHYSCNSDNSVGLYSVAQSTRIECLSVFEQSGDMTRSFNGMVDVLKNAYDEIGIPYQVVIVSAEELKPAETIRIQLEVWSPVLKRYFPCSSVSMYSDYLSKRLMIQYGVKKDKPQGYLLCAGATAVSIPVLVASIMENMQRGNEHFSIPKALQAFIL